jgi:hypothetical protein
MVLGLPDPLVRVTDPDPSIINQKSKKNLDSYSFVTFLFLINDENVPSKSNWPKNTKILLSSCNVGH